jgi:hypothetical protein
MNGSPGGARPISVNCEKTDCTKQQAMSFTPSEFEEWLEKGIVGCESCGQEMSVKGVSIECYICEEEFEGYSLAQIPLLLDDRCHNCAGREEWDAEIYSIRIAGSWSSEYDKYDWRADRKQIGPLEREGRTDYWEGLVHFCNAEQFISIYKDRRIRAYATGLCKNWCAKKTKAVCLSEATLPNWDELKKSHGEYGFVFRKREVVDLGGAPAIYLPHLVIERMKKRKEVIPKTLWPYLNLLKPRSSQSGRRHDYLHEREWRMPRDMPFDTIRPYAVTFARERPKIDDEELILDAAREFHELSQRRFGPRGEMDTW